MPASSGSRPRATTGCGILDTAPAGLEIVYDAARADPAELAGVDNVVVSTGGEVFVAEDGGNMEICVLVAGGAVAVVRISGTVDSEVTGPAFSPDGRRLYFSSQRDPGRTYEVTGPFNG